MSSDDHDRRWIVWRVKRPLSPARHVVYFTSTSTAWVKDASSAFRMTRGNAEWLARMGSLSGCQVQELR